MKETGQEKRDIQKIMIFLSNISAVEFVKNGYQFLSLFEIHSIQSKNFSYKGHISTEVHISWTSLAKMNFDFFYLKILIKVYELYMLSNVFDSI